MRHGREAVARRDSRSRYNFAVEVARLTQYGTFFDLVLVREGKAVIERRVDTDAATRTDHPTERAAVHAYHAALANRFETGWRRVGPIPEPAEAIEEPNLVHAALHGDVDALTVYNDWLLDRGDPRGEYAALRAAPVPNVSRLSQLQTDHDLEILGPLCAFPAAWREQFQYTWKSGWIDEITCRRRFSAAGYVDGHYMTEALHLALHAPIARFVQAFAVDAAYATRVAALRDCPRVAGIRALRLFGDGGDDAALLAALPALQTIDVCSTIDAGHPRVHTMRARIEPYIEGIMGSWPALRRLELQLGGTHEVPALLAGFFAAEAFSQLTSLALAADNGVNAHIIRALIGSPFFSRLERLELRAPLHQKPRALLEAARNANALEVVYV